MSSLPERLNHALSRIRNPRTGADVLSSEMVRDLATTTSGKVRLTLLLAAGDPATLVRDVRQTLERVEGVTEVRVDVRDPAEMNAPAQRGASVEGTRPAPGRALPVMDAR
ncbi:MAG TPA: iron-sulfur cluster assembly protein, partial [Gemmatimonadaceae bacterium]|nr:iron-sulfur cluster assembly protein [Gemmatimonadaceae bacterium]